MARDECTVCEAQFPGGKGLKDGLCKGCRAARRAMREDAAKAAEPEAEPGEE